MAAKWTKIGVMWKGKETGKLPSGRPDGLLAAMLPSHARLVMIKNERKQRQGAGCFKEGKGFFSEFFVLVNPVAFFEL